MLSNFLVSWIRTVVPVGVGLLATWLAASLHIVLTPHSQEALAGLAVLVLTAVYYSLVRLLEHYVPQAGVLLGVPAKPNYGAIAGQAQVVAEEIITGGPDPTEPAPIAGPITAAHVANIAVAAAQPPAELPAPPAAS